MVATDLHSIEKSTLEVHGFCQHGYPRSLKYLPLCWNAHRFGTTWGWVNDDRIFIFGWAIP